ncbi:MAG TPA: AI-2E family transporter [Chloroflexota bacterium]|nr:AI-2E family transporter [Chloroflexota bacterium]
MKTDSAPRSVTLPVAEQKAAPLPAPTSLGTPGAETVPPVRAETLPPPRVVPFSPRARVWTVSVLGLLAFLFLLRVASILTPFLWGIVAAYCFNPLVRVLCRRSRLPRFVVVAALYVAWIGALVAVFSVAVPRLNAQVNQLANDLPTIVSDLQARYFGTTTNQPLQVGGFTIDVPQITRQLANSLNSFVSNFVGGTYTAVIGAVGRVAQFFLFLIVTFYLLVDAPNIGAKLTLVIPARHREEVLEVGKQMDHVLTQYLRAQLILIGLMSVASFVVLSLMGVRFAFVLAPIVGILEIFPVIGPFAAITVVTLIALLSPPNYGLSHTGSALIVALAFFILRQLEDYAVIPNVIGHAVRLHPVLILFAVTAGATFGGALGLFLAVPVTGALRILAVYLYEKMDLK